jgi:hypothetical protein
VDGPKGECEVGLHERVNDNGRILTFASTSLIERKVRIKEKCRWIEGRDQDRLTQVNQVERPNHNFLFPCFYSSSVFVTHLHHAAHYEL